MSANQKLSRCWPEASLWGKSRHPTRVSLIRERDLHEAMQRTQSNLLSAAAEEAKRQLGWGVPAAYRASHPEAATIL